MEPRKTRKNTTELLRDLKRTATFSDFVKRNSSSLKHSEFTETLNRLYRAQGRSKAEIARAAGISEAYLYQICSGARVPSRNRLLCVCIGMKAEIEDTQMLLKQCGYAPLYPREKRDAVILHGLMHGMELNSVNDTLFEEGEEPLLG